MCESYCRKLTTVDTPNQAGNNTYVTQRVIAITHGSSSYP